MGSPHWISIMTYSGKPVATAALEQKFWTKFPSKWNIDIILWCSIARLKKNLLFVPISLMLTFERRINVESDRIKVAHSKNPTFVYIFRYHYLLHDTFTASFFLPSKGSFVGQQLYDCSRRLSFRNIAPISDISN